MVTRQEDKDYSRLVVHAALVQTGNLETNQSMYVQIDTIKGIIKVQQSGQLGMIQQTVPCFQ